MSIIGGVIFMVVFLALIAGMIYYLSKRLALFFSTASIKWWITGLSGMTVFVGFVQFLPATPDFIGRTGNIIGSFWMVGLVSFTLAVAIIDLINLFVKIKPSVRGFLSLGLVSALLIGGFIRANSIRVKEVSIPIAGLTKEVKAVHITDIHLGDFWGKERLNKVVETTMALHPDVVFNTGDMFDSQVHFSENSDVLEPLKKLTVPHYFVHGNHDEYEGVEIVVERMKNAGAIVLQNEIADFGELQIIGLNNMAKDTITFDVHAVAGAETVESVMAQLPVAADRPTIVLHHRPEGVEYMAAKSADLLLSGHTHAGQVFPFTLMAKSMFTYNKGLYSYKNMHIYVSEGVGTVFVPLRIGTSSDITLIRLVPE
ncbi:metallophosphoesterase [Parabacteroides sp. OttesenSCG-928-G07]|nr:metallophosphoesterase [Parabacteroides sp. OttesenSCG-928-G21]MDL2277586.1 metallophosphoesterase [Parabacteroides sp. OttesenSCG-928-G07]